MRCGAVAVRVLAMLALIGLMFGLVYSLPMLTGDGLCSFACHDHICPHTPVFGAWLTSDAGWFGLAIEALFSLGRHIHRDKFMGYGIVNLLIFVVAFPASWAGLLAVYLRLGPPSGAVR